MTTAAPPLPLAPPSNDPLRAALEQPATLDNLRRQAHVVLSATAPPRPAVEDVVQEVVARALNGRAGYDPARGSVGGWLHGFLVRVAKEQLRELRGLPAQPPGDAGFWERAAPIAGPTDESDGRFLVERYLAKLSPTDRAVVKLRQLEDRDYPDIAARLGVTAVHARKLYSRAILELKRLAVGGQEGRS